MVCIAVRPEPPLLTLRGSRIFTKVDKIDSYATEPLGIILVDHGSRRDESNQMLLSVVELFAAETGYQIVEPAHMELAEPSIQTAFDRCVQRGARRIVVHPFFLFPGRHWSEDIPRLAASAARKYPDVRFLVSGPLGVHPLITSLSRLRIEDCLEFASKNDHDRDCPFCTPSTRCQFRSAPVPNS